MKQGIEEHISKGKEKVNTAIDWGSVLLVFLFPLASGGIFLRVRDMGGAPGWMYVILGVFFALSVAQTVYYLVVILIRVIRGRKAAAGKGERAS